MWPGSPLQARNLRWLHLATYTALALMAVIGLAGLSAAVDRGLALGLCLAFGAIYTATFRAARTERQIALYLALQTLLVSVVLARLNDETGTFSFLFVVLGVQAALLLTGRPAAAWLAAFFVITSALILAARGAAGLINILFNAAAYGMVGLLIGALQRAELARRENQRLLDELQTAHRQLQDYAEQSRQLAVVEERGRLARDLHDSVKQQVFALLMQLGAARALLDEEDPARLPVDEAERLARQAGGELTALIRALRPAALDNKALPAALQAHVADWSRQNGITADLQLDAERPLPLAVEEALFRIAQESLSNVARHSGAERVAVRLAYAAGEARLAIHDNGRGFEQKTGGAGLGLASMAERMAAVGGHLHVESAPGQGTRVMAVCAYREQPG